MSQTVVLEQQQTTVTPQTITLKFDDCASTSNPNPTPTVDSETPNPVTESSDPKTVDGASDPIPIPFPDVDPQIQAAVEAFIQRSGSSDEEARTAARDDLRSYIERDEVAIAALLDLAKYAKDVDNADLLDIVCQRVADMIKDKSVEEVREIFNITNDFTPEEEQAIRDEHPWAFED